MVKLSLIVYKSPLGTHSYMRHTGNAKQSGKSRTYTWSFSHTLGNHFVVTSHHIPSHSIMFRHILALSTKSRDFTIQEWTKSFLTSPPLTVQSCWPYLILSPTTKQIWPHLIRLFLHNLHTTQISPCNLIIPVADTHRVAETRIVAALLWLTQILPPPMFSAMTFN